MEKRNIRRHLIWMSALIISLIFISGAYAQSTIQETTYAKVGKEFTIIQKCNPTTGYHWEVKADSRYLKLEKTEYIPDNLSLIGSGGQYIYTFKCIKTGSTEILLQLYEPGGSGLVEEVTYPVNILPVGIVPLKN